MSCIAFAADRPDINVPCRWRTRSRSRRLTTVPRSTARRARSSPGRWPSPAATFATIFVSGTASITESETRHVGDPAGPDPPDAGQHRGPDRRRQPRRNTAFPDWGRRWTAWPWFASTSSGRKTTPRSARSVRSPARRAAHYLRRGRRLPARPARGNRGDGLLAEEVDPGQIFHSTAIGWGAALGVTLRLAAALSHARAAPLDFLHAQWL